MRVLVTGGAGFIGANFVHTTLGEKPQATVTVIDHFGYAGNRASLQNLPADQAERLTIVSGDIADRDTIDPLVADSDVVVHFAAESHNDNSLLDPSPFIKSNILGTFEILEAVRRHGVRLHHISTDEVFGDLELDDPNRFTAASPYKPSSPYSASKASSDHLVRAWARSFNIAATISNCSNNYGPYQHIEKFIPRMITNRIDGIRPRLYGDGLNVRDWIHVLDHNSAVWAIIERGRLGQTYLIGADGEENNRSVVEILNELMGYEATDFDHVADRAGHDRRYAIDPTVLREELGWQPHYSNFRSGLTDTIEWYRTHESWWRPQKAQVEAKYARLGQ